jgi:hypothetical protein
MIHIIPNSTKISAVCYLQYIRILRQIVHKAPFSPSLPFVIFESQSRKQIHIIKFLDRNTISGGGGSVSRGSIMQP